MTTSENYRLAHAEHLALLVARYARAGITYTVEPYTGRKIGKGGFMARVGMQIVARHADTGKRAYVFCGSPCYKMACGASHYRSGMSKDTAKRMDDAREGLGEIAYELGFAALTLGEDQR